VPVKGRKDALLLDTLSVGNVDETLQGAVEQIGPEGILYVSDTMKKPEVPGPDVRRVLKLNLARWCDRVGLEMQQCRMEDMRIYAVFARQ